MGTAHSAAGAGYAVAHIARESAVAWHRVTNKFELPMSESNIQHLEEEDALEQIVETVQQAPVGAAPFALALGAGFSFGLVPTAREMVEEYLPLWVAHLKRDQPF